MSPNPAGPSSKDDRPLPWWQNVAGVNLLGPHSPFPRPRRPSRHVRAAGATKPHFANRPHRGQPGVQGRGAQARLGCGPGTADAAGAAHTARASASRGQRRGAGWAPGLGSETAGPLRAPAERAARACGAAERTEPRPRPSARRRWAAGRNPSAAPAQWAAGRRAQGPPPAVGPATLRWRLRLLPAARRGAGRAGGPAGRRRRGRAGGGARPAGRVRRPRPGHVPARAPPPRAAGRSSAAGLR